MNGLRKVAASCLLAVPVALAFRAGGYFPEPRLVAGIVVWVLAIGGVLTLDGPLSSGRDGWFALGGLALLAAATGLSIEWAPFGTVAWNDFGRLVVYVGFFVAGLALLRGRFGLRSVELVTGAGAALVAIYALSGRLLPGLVHQNVSISAGGRIDQPLTYWNAVGILSAVGFVLAVRIAGDEDRRRSVALVAAGLSVPLGLATYLTFSRGSLLAGFAGLFVMVILTRSVRLSLVCGVLVAGALVASVVAGLLPGVRALEGSLPARESQGVWMIVALLVIAGVAAIVTDRLRAREGWGTLRLRSGVAAAGVLILLVAFVAAAAGGGQNGGQPAVGADSRRLASFESNRYDYWAVAGGMFLAQPLRGEGSGSFRAVWRRERNEDDRALDAHSLFLEVPAELGLLGLAGLILTVGGIAAAAVRAARFDALLAAGPVSALAAMAIHSGLDWDWEFPTLAGIILMIGAALAGARDAGREDSGDRSGAGG